MIVSKSSSPTTGRNLEIDLLGSEIIESSSSEKDLFPPRERFLISQPNNHFISNNQPVVNEILSIKNKMDLDNKLGDSSVNQTLTITDSVIQPEKNY